MIFRRYYFVLLTVSVAIRSIASEDSPYSSSSSYAPKLLPCPSNFQVRQIGTPRSRKQDLAPQEATYIASRRSKVIPEAYDTYLRNVERYLSSFNRSDAKLPSYVSKILSSKNQTTLPRMSLAVAGGAYRGAIYGASVMNVFDGKNATSTESGLGGLLQTFDYVTGLSGSAWLLTSWMESELAPLFDLVLGSTKVGRNDTLLSGWLTQYGLLNPTDALGSDTVAQRIRNRWLETVYWTRLIRQVSSKRWAGFPVGIVDLWGRILSHHFLSGSNPDNFFNGSVSHGISQTFSGFVNLTTFKNYTQPFPIFTTLPHLRDSRSTFPTPYNATHYEITPYEFGSYDPFLSSFVSTDKLGTKLSDGIPIDQTKCVKGFDNAGFIMGASSNFFPAYKFLLNSYFNLTQNLAGYTPHVLTARVPNPFLGLGTQDYLEKKDTELHLIDGGFSFEVTPYAPLLIEGREVEVIISIDGTGDSSNFANGSSIVKTAQRAAHYADIYKFPQVPLNVTDYTTFELVKRPTFFGCEESEAPLLVWIANSAPIDGSRSVLNTSTLQLSYPINETEAMMNEATQIGIRGFPSHELISKGIYKDPLWPACLSCAVVDRARKRLGVERQDLCRTCFERHCWPKPSNTF